MQFWLIPVLGLAPGLFWLWLIYRGNKYRPEPKRLVIRTFLFGMAAVIPVMFVETALILPYVFTHLQQLRNYSIADINNLSLGQTAYLSFIVAGFTEELFKFLVVRTSLHTLMNQAMVWYILRHRRWGLLHWRISNIYFNSAGKRHWSERLSPHWRM